jgi:hypothetical protein
MRNAYRILVGRQEGKMPVGRTSKTWEDNIKIDFKEFDYDAVKWAYLVVDRII